MRVERVYDQADYENASYFIPKPVQQFMSYDSRTSEGVLKLEPTHLQVEKKIGFVGWAFIVVTNDLMLKLQQAKLRHISFRETLIEDEKDVEERYEVLDNFWELTSDLIMPPMSPESKFVNYDGQIFTGDFSKGCFLRDGFVANPEPHYLASSLDLVVPFDLALTHERFGNHQDVAYQTLVASKNFYNFCFSNQLMMNWIPVRVDQ